jgi:hypothetical protein
LQKAVRSRASISGFIEQIRRIGLAQHCRPEYCEDNALTTPGAMSHSADALYRMSDLDLLTAYAEARRQFVEKKFARDTQRARLVWIRAKMFTSSTGGVTERNMAIDVSEEIARKGQEVREMTRDLDLFKVDVDIIATVIRFRGLSTPAGAHNEDAGGGDAGHEEQTASD